MNSRQQSEQRDRQEQFGFRVGELAIYKAEPVKIMDFPTKWSALIISTAAIGDAIGEVATTKLISILQLKPISSEKK